jgi:drug/metabolite transporter (DMT)-like permease
MTTPGPSQPADLASPTVLKGVLIAVFSMFLFSSAHTSVRILSDTMSTFEIVFWRMAVSMAILLPWFAWKGMHLLRTHRPGMHALRAIVNFSGMILWFYAISIVPLGKAVAIHFTLPLFLLLFAVIFLGERIGPRRIAATAVGFAGAMIVMRPGAVEIGWPELMILASAALYGGTVVFLKFMVKTETPLALTFYTNAFISVFCLPPAIWFWVGPTVDDIMPILLLGVMGTFAPFLYTTALRMADASLIGPTDFLRLPISAGFAFVLFGEVPVIWVWVGGGVIFLSTWYITARESRIERERRAAGAAKGAGNGASDA